MFVNSAELKMLYSWSCTRAYMLRESFGNGKRRASVRSQFQKLGCRRMPFGTLPKLPTVELNGVAIANAAGLKCI
ncbi:hypothetical protein D3C83_194980 [compost metagenome]